MRYLSMVKLCGMSWVENVTRTRSSCCTSTRAGLKAYLCAETVMLRSPLSCARASSVNAATTSTSAAQRNEEDVIDGSLLLGEGSAGSCRTRPGLRTETSLLRFAGGRTGGRGTRGGAFVLQQGLAAEADLAGGVNVDDLHHDLFAFLQLVAHVLHAMVRDLGDVQQPVRARHDFDERTEIGDALHLAHVGLVELGRRGQLLDDADGFLCRRFISRRHVHAAIVLDVDFHARALDDAADHLATGSDDVADLVDRNLDGDDARRIRRDVAAWAGEGLL